MDTNLRPSRLEGLGDMAWGTHFCLFYETEQDLLETLALYFKPGLASHEFCLWITSDSSNENAIDALRRVIPSADQRLEAGDIEIISCQQWYCENDEFNAARVVQMFDTKLAQALEKGYARMRVLGDEAWLDRERWKVFSEYEGTLDERFAGKPLSILCAYPTAPHSAADILDIARTHNFIVAKRNGNWEILEAPQLKHAKAESEWSGAEPGAQDEEQKTRDSRQGLNRSVMFRYGVPFLTVGLALGATFLLQPYVFGTPLFLLSIMISTWVGGMGPGLLAVLLSTLGISLFLSPAGILETRFQNIPNVISFLITALLVGSWSDARGRAGAALRRARDELEDRVLERTANLRQVNQALQAGTIEHERNEEALRTNEYRLQAAIDAADIVLWERDLSSGQIIWLGPHEKLLGFAPGELSDNTLADFEKRVHPEDIEDLRTVRQRALEERSEYSHEYRVVWRDDSIHWIRAQGRFIYNEAGQPVRLYGAVQDITGRKQAEEATKEHEEQLRLAFEAARIGTGELDLQSYQLTFSTALQQILGLAPGTASLSFQEYAEWIYPEDRAIVQQEIEKAIAGKPDMAFDCRIIWPDGSVHWVTARARTFYNREGKATRLAGALTDITERKRAEEALRESEELYRFLTENSHDVITLYDLNQNRVYASPSFSRVLGWLPEATFGGIHPDDVQASKETWQRVVAGEKTVFAYRHSHVDGSWRWLEAWGSLVHYRGQPHVMAVTRDITERKHAEEAIRKSERVLREAEALGHTGSWEQDLVTGELFNTEENLRIFFGKDRSKGESFEDYPQVVHPDDREYVLQRRANLLEEEGPGDIEYRVVWPDGSVHVIFGRATVVRDELGQPIRVYGTNVDITERKSAEEEMHRQAARAETLARIAARLNKQLDLDAVIHAVCEEAVDTFKVSQATMSLYDKKRDLLIYAGGVNIPPKHAATMEPITRSQFDEFLRSMGPIMVVPDIQSVPEVPNARFSSALDVRTVVTAVMLRDLELVGALVVGVNGRVREFDKDELTLLKAISHQAAQAIANAQLLKTANEQHEQLRSLSAKLVEVEEAERRTLTSELHDRVGQNLTGLSINLQNMKAMLSGEAPITLAAKFDDAQALVQDTARQIRDIMAELHPPELEDYGLAAALETYAERAASRGNLELIADLPDLPGPSLPAVVQIALFRAAQEAISNGLKHAEATQLEVSLEQRDGRIRLRIEDDGRGFEPEADSQKEARTWGLKIMRERIESIGGNVQIESKPGEGTRVTFEFERPQ